MTDLLEVTGGEGDVLAVTHEHWGHVSGFSQAAEEFDKLKVGAGWLAWTEGDNDEIARSLRQERAPPLATFTASAERLALDNASAAEGVLNASGHFGAAGEKTKAALDSAKAKVTRGQSARFWKPTDPPLQLNDPNLRIYALGPPHDAKALRKTLPSKS